MSSAGGFAPGGGARWIAERILAAYGRCGGGEAPGVPRLSRPQIDGLIARTLEEELARLEPSPPLPPE